MAVIKFPFMSLQQLNLDWLLEQMKKVMQFLPFNGVAGDVLQRTVDGAAWQPLAAVSLDIHSLDALTDPVAGNDELPIYDNSAQGNYKVEVSDLMLQAPVQSVNGQTGAVTLSIPTDTSDLTNTAGFVDAAGAAAAAPVQSVNGQTGAVNLPLLYLTDPSGFVTVTITPTPALTVSTNSLRVDVSDDKRFIRVSGFLVYQTDNNSDWKQFKISDQNGDPFDIEIPAVRRVLHNAGMLFDQTNTLAAIADAVRIYIETDGTVDLFVWQGTSTAGLDQTPYLFGQWIQIE